MSKLMKIWEDEPGVVVLVPELETRLLKGLKHAIKAIWWLSIDHYLDLIRQEKEAYKALAGFEMKLFELIGQI